MAKLVDTVKVLLTKEITTISKKDTYDNSDFPMS
jgi:hypothetical protein